MFLLYTIRKLNVIIHRLIVDDNRFNKSKIGKHRLYSLINER